MKLDFYTSFNPRDVGQQYKSWLLFANKIYAVQDPSENIEVNCEKIYNKAADFDGKKFQRIRDLIRIGQSRSEYFCIINSDIKIQQNQENWNKITSKLDENSIVVGHKYDYDEGKNPVLNWHGLDFFILNKKIVFDNDKFLMGQCAWDWYLLYISTKQNLDVYLIDFPFLFHKMHSPYWNINKNNYLTAQDWFQEATGIDRKEKFIKFNLNRYLINKCKNI